MKWSLWEEKRTIRLAKDAKFLDQECPETIETPCWRSRGRGSFVLKQNVMANKEEIMVARRLLFCSRVKECMTKLKPD
jgi:hypothetical protein